MNPGKLLPFAATWLNLVVGVPGANELMAYGTTFRFLLSAVALPKCCFVSLF